MFRIVDSETGQDLVFGPNSKYDPKGFRLYSIRGLDTLDYPLNSMVFYSNPETEIINADIYQPYGTLYLRYPNGKIDTLEAKFKQYDSECCGQITELIQLIRNKSETYEAVRDVLEFKD